MPMAKGAVVPDHAFEVSSAIRVRHVQTPIAQVLCIDQAQPMDLVAALLAAKGFDEAPVTRDGAIVGLIRPDRASSSLSAKDAMEPLGVGSFVGADAGIGSLLQWLTDRSSYLVLDGREISGLVTRADLNKQPVRTHFYLLLATVEMGLADAIRRAYRKQDRILSLLSEERARRVRARFEEERAADADSDLVAVLDFVDVMTVSRKTPSIDSRITATSQVRLKTIAGKAARIRNHVMHPTRPGLVAPDLNVEHLAITERSLQAITDAVATLPKRLPPAPRPARTPAAQAPTAQSGLR